LSQDDLSVLLICGIAEPQPLRDALQYMTADYTSLLYRDHHIFHSADLKEIKKRFAVIKNEKKIILTTEKDGVRLTKFEKDLEHLPVYVIPMAHRFLFDESARFEKQVMDFADGFRDAV
jgi:tetraacyldisaccharide 4'-kinase